MTKIDLMIFDLDGTLVMSGTDIAASVNHTLRALDLPVIADDVILGYVGDGVQKLIERALGENGRDRLHDAMDVFATHYHEHMLDVTTLYDGVRELLHHFRDKRKIILTNKGHRFTMRMTDALKISDCFDEIIGADSTPYIKPDARLVYPLLARYGVRDDRTVIIGDGVNDILLAHHAGIRSCACLRGLTDPARLLALSPDFTCENLLDLKNIFV
jgi:phosphoglycolate phosphatase